MKKFLKNILYWLSINAFLFFFHFWALICVAFNDSGAKFDSVFDALHIIFTGITPLIIGSIILSYIFKKEKDFSKYQFFVLQSIVLVAWFIFYTINYIPNV